MPRANTTFRGTTPSILLSDVKHVRHSMGVGSASRFFGGGSPLPVLLLCATAAADGTTRVKLENGLTVICRPVEGAQHVALVTLFRIGDHDDPAGRSGMGHLVEHLYVTAATDTAAACDARVVDRIREGTYRAVTYDRCTVFATVVPAARLADELRDVVGRMGTLRIEERDVARERRAVGDEQAERFAWFSSGTAGALAHERTHPPPRGGSGGGLREHVDRMTPEELSDRWQRYYKPRNAILVLAGCIDPGVVESLVARLFAGLPTGEPVPFPEKRENDAVDRPLGVETLRCMGPQPDAKPYACYCWAGPDPTSDDFAPFLVHAARLASSSGVAEVQYVPLSSSTIALVVPTEDGTFAGLDALAKGLAAPLGDNDVALVRLHFGFMLGLTVPRDAALREPGSLRGEPGEDLCGLALGLAHRERVGFEGARLAEALKALSDKDLGRAREIFAPERAAKVLLVPE